MGNVSSGDLIPGADPSNPNVDVINYANVGDACVAFPTHLYQDCAKKFGPDWENCGDIPCSANKTLGFAKCCRTAAARQRRDRPVQNTYNTSFDNSSSVNVIGSNNKVSQTTTMGVGQSGPPPAESGITPMILILIVIIVAAVMAAIGMIIYAATDETAEQI